MEGAHNELVVAAAAGSSNTEYVGFFCIRVFTVFGVFLALFIGRKKRRLKTCLVDLHLTMLAPVFFSQCASELIFIFWIANTWHAFAANHQEFVLEFVKSWF